MSLELKRKLPEFEELHRDHGEDTWLYVTYHRHLNVLALKSEERIFESAIRKDLLRKWHSSWGLKSGEKA